MIAPIEPTVDPPAILDIARDYTARGWRVVPIPPRTKAPRLRGWQTLRLDAADLPAHFSPRAAANIGVMTGEPSGWLIDIDLDHPAAIDLADAHLPATGAEWGRKSRPRSHRLYVVTAPTTTRKHTSASGGMLVELRSTGCQTVAPGSVHPCGEPVRWDRDGEPARVAPDALHDAVRRLADAVRETLGESPTSTPPRNADAPARPAATDDRQRAIDALARLSPARADAYHAWIDVGMALHAVCPTLLAEWDRWSRASRKYRDGETAHKWESFGGGGGLTLGSLIHWAGQDDPGGESSADALGWLRRVLRLPDLSGIVRRGEVYELARGAGEPIIIGAASALLRQTTIRAALLGATGQYVAVDRREWPRVAETIARQAVVVETITDADLLRSHLRGYLARCESRMTGDPWEWLAECDRPGRGCWRDEDGRTWLHLPPLLAHLASAECGSRATAAEVCALLTRDGWERQQLYRVRDGARRGRRMWRGPSDLAQRLEDA